MARRGLGLRGDCRFGRLPDAALDVDEDSAERPFGVVAADRTHRDVSSLAVLPEPQEPVTDESGSESRSERVRPGPHHYH